jgi:hypothetical protein
MVERQPQRLEGRSFGIIQGRSPHPICAVSYRFGSGRMMQHDQVPHAGQLGAQLLQHRAAVDVAAGPDAVHGDQHRGLDLAEAVEHGVGAHVGRAHAPHRADADDGQEGDDGLGHVGQVGRHAVARPHALRLQVQRQRRHLAPQLGPAQLARLALLVVADDGRQAGGVRRIDVAQHLVRVVGLRARKPLGARHDVAAQHRRVRVGERSSK